MFFSLSKKKLIKISIISAILILSAVSSFFLNKKWKIAEASSLYGRNIKENISYWWSNKASFHLNPNDPSFFLKNLASLGSNQSIDYRSEEDKARSIPVLAYHGTPNEGGEDNPFSNINFFEHMNSLKSAGWQTISLEQFSSFIKGQEELPEKSFLLTFDDGRKDTYYPSDPVLKDLGFRAVMFAITKKSFSPESNRSSYYLSEFELKEMEKSNRWEVESHGRDSHDWYYVDTEGNIGHFFSNRLWLSDQGRIETDSEFRDRVVYDLSNSKRDLEESLNRRITTFAFPFSDFGQDTVNYPGSRLVLEEEVPKFYELAFYQIWPGSGETFNYPESGQFMMKRIEPLSSWTGNDLLTTLESGVSKDLPYERDSFGKEWIGSWGDVSMGDTINLKAKNDTGGSSAALNGSWWWKDYTFNADVAWHGGSNIVLIGRRGTDYNYYGCNFSGNKIAVKKVVNGSSYNVSSIDYDLHSLGKNLSLGISVKGHDISCLVNGNEVLIEGSINWDIPEGGIGLEVWDNANGVASASFDNLSVDPN